MFGTRIFEVHRDGLTAFLCQGVLHMLSERCLSEFRAWRSDLREEDMKKLRTAAEMQDGSCGTMAVSKRLMQSLGPKVSHSVDVKLKLPAAFFHEAGTLLGQWSGPGIVSANVTLISLILDQYLIH